MLAAHLSAYKHLPRCGLALAGVFALSLALFFEDALFGPDLFAAFDLAVAAGGLLGILLLSSTSGRVARVQPLLICAGAAGAAIGHLAITHLALPPVVAGSLCAALIGLLAVRHLPLLVAVTAYSGVAAGTGVAAVLHGPAWVLLAGTLAGLVWSIGVNVWSGVGGKIGFVGLIGSSVALFICERYTGARPPLLSRPPYELMHLLMIPVAAISATVTRLLIARARWNVVLASALPSFLVAYGLLLTKSPLAASVGTAWFGASFIGMTCTTRIPRLWPLALGGICFGLLMLRLQPAVIGHAGVLGSMACLSVMAVASLDRLLASDPSRPAIPVPVESLEE